MLLGRRWMRGCLRQVLERMTSAQSGLRAGDIAVTVERTRGSIRSATPPVRRRFLDPGPLFLSGAYVFARASLARAGCTRLVAGDDEDRFLSGRGRGAALPTVHARCCSNRQEGDVASAPALPLGRTAHLSPLHYVRFRSWRIARQHTWRLQISCCNDCTTPIRS